MNPGAIIGGIIGAGGAAFFVFSGDAELRRPGKAIGLGVVVGAAVGGWLWSLVRGGSGETAGDSDDE